MTDLRPKTTPVFITTDNIPIFIGDRYHIIKNEGVEQWRCDEGDKIPTEDTYSDWKIVQMLQIKRTKEKESKERVNDRNSISL